MIVARTVERVRDIVKKTKKKGRLIGFIPTMGALHEGHLSLIRGAHKECDFVVVSIFVNPTQFGAGEDFHSYPRDFKKDESLLKKEGVNLVFYPKVSTMYPKDFSTYVEEVSLSKYLCGKFRPGHFRGVCTVVVKLFNIVTPDIAYFGQKDFQQAQIIKRMVRDLNFPIKIKILPIIREKDGLAMSSRNSYLSSHQRKLAPYLYKSLILAKELILKKKYSLLKIRNEIKRFIKRNIPSAKIDYIDIVSPETLQELRKIDKGKILVALAVYLGRARLIDNILVRVR
ncbi:MAG: pantoate--beta-alanine ligase [Candidatus Omnitrophica bacterium]|nr:pantoate--beta-alanine ligase [Candidatus Omnitrophota bacterium]